MKSSPTKLLSKIGSLTANVPKLSLPWLKKKEVGFALFFHNFSTFLGRSGLYLEDLYVMPEYRHQGIGTALFHELARIAVARECGRLEWWCLDWNQAGIDFYKGLGAEAMDEWTVYRLSGDTLQRLAE